MNQSQYPNSGSGNGGQNPWMGYNVPQPQAPYPCGAPLPPQNMYGYGYGMPASVPDALPAYQSADTSGSAVAIKRRPYLLALIVFPFQCLRVFVLPVPGTFSKEKDRVGWGALFTVLVVFALLAGLLLYAWGRVPRLTLAAQALSLDHIIAHSLPVSVCEILALASPLVFLLLVGVMHLFAKKVGGKGRYREQVYTSLLITMPLVGFIALAVLALISVSALSGSLHFVFELIVLAFFLYSIMLHIFATIAVQGLGVGKATLVVLCTVVALLVIIVIVALLVMSLGNNNSSSSDSHSSSGSGSSRQHGPSQQGSKSESEHGHDDFDLDFESESHKRHHASPAMVMAFCPQCGLRTSLPAWQAQMGVSCPRCGTPMIMA